MNDKSESNSTREEQLCNFSLGAQNPKREEYLAKCSLFTEKVISSMRDTLIRRLLDRGVQFEVSGDKLNVSCKYEDRVNQVRNMLYTLSAYNDFLADEIPVIEEGDYDTEVIADERGLVSIIPSKSPDDITTFDWDLV